MISLRQILQAIRDARIQQVMTARNVVTAGCMKTKRVLLENWLNMILWPCRLWMHANAFDWGLSPYDDAMDVVQAETTEDFLKAGAVSAKAGMSIKTAPILKLVSKAGILVGNIGLGSLLSGLGISYYEDIIAAHIVLVCFLALIGRKWRKCRFTICDLNGACV